MAATAPPVITALPAPPDPNDRSTFNVRAYPWSVAQQTLATEVGAVAANVYANATEAVNAAAIAVPAAAAAEAASNATLWVSGTTYAAGDVVWSPINALSYRRKSAGAGTTDPSADSANWAALAGGTPSLTRSARTSNTIIGAVDKGTLIDITSGTFSQTFDAAATLGDGWWCYLRNSGTGVVTLDPNATETIDGVETKALDPLQTAIVQCDGIALRTVPISGVGNHHIIVNTGNRYGSTNNQIRRFTTTQSAVGTAITYADSATLGASFTINENGLYSVTYVDARTVSGVARLGVSLNSNTLASDINSIAASQRICISVVPAESSAAEGCVSTTVRLVAGDVLRAHVGLNSPDSGGAVVSFTVRKVGL